MNCPKCGFSQEERLDCRKCGVVFSKYYAIHATNKPVATDVLDAAQPQFEVAEGSSADIAGLQQSFRELNGRLNEVEFERAQRTQLRGELRVLDQKVSTGLAQVLERLSALEQHAADVPIQPPAVSPEDIQQLKNLLLDEHLAPVSGRLDHVEVTLEALSRRLEERAAAVGVQPPTASPGETQQLRDLLLDEHFAPIRGRMEQIEERMKALPKEFALKPDPWSIEMLGQFEHRMTELEGKIAALAETSRAQRDGFPQDMEKLCKDIDELRVSLQNVTMRYSEIGDLKKNHLVLLNQVESFQYQLQQAKKTPDLVSNRVPELETEISALRAEVRQCLNRLEQLEAASPAASRDFGVVMKELEGSKKMHAEQSERMQEALESRLKKELEPFLDIANRLTGIDQRQQSLERNFEEVHVRTWETSQRITDIDKTAVSMQADLEKIRNDLRSSEEKLTALLACPPEEPRPPLEEDVHVIRETLDELRRFLGANTGKP